MAVKVSACCFCVAIDFGDGDSFIVMGFTDSITPWNRSKTIVDTATLDCQVDTRTGREEQSTMSFTQYYDPQDENMQKLDNNFDASRCDPSGAGFQVRLLSPAYESRPDVGPGVGARVVVEEAAGAVSEISREELTPDGYYKRVVTLVRQGPITQTVEEPGSGLEECGDLPGGIAYQ